MVVGIMSSCGTTKIERQAQKTFKGDWTLTDISYPNGVGLVDVTLFGDASRKCFLNSNWHFVSNNNKGNYELYGDDCTSGKRTFYWNVKENSDEGLYFFTLKPADTGKDARKSKSGYRLELMSLDETTMVWEETVRTNEGKSLLIHFQFSKN